jgi:hypothetical protein
MFIHECDRPHRPGMEVSQQQESDEKDILEQGIDVSKTF